MPGPAVQNYMLGTWFLALKYQPSPDFPNGATGQGTEVWWAGPGGYSMIEEYYQNDANEHVEEFSPAWWDEEAGGQRFLYCGNTVPEGCYFSKGVFRWEDDNLVFREERERGGKKITYSLTFRDITPRSFTQVNAEGDSGNPAKPTLTIRASKVFGKPALTLTSRSLYASWHTRGFYERAAVPYGNTERLLRQGGIGRQLMTFPAESICFIFSTRRTRVSSFFASEYHTMNSFLCVNDKAFSFWVSFVPSARRSGKGTSISRFSVSGSSLMVTRSPALTPVFLRTSALTTMY